MPAVAEESRLLASDIGPRRRPIFFLHALFSVVGELMLGTIHRCRRSGILAAHFTFVPRPIQLVTRATLYIYGGKGFWIFYCCFVPELSLSSLRCRPYEPCGAPCLYPRSGVGWKLNRCRLINCASLPGRIFTTLPRAFQGFDWVIFAAVGVLLGLCPHSPFFACTRSFHPQLGLS